MLATPRTLALEVKSLDRSRLFYESLLGVPIREERDDEVVVDIGDTDLHLRTPGRVPRGGLHTHFALSVSRERYDDWYARLDEQFDLVEQRFGEARSLYCDDPDGHCVELGETEETGDGIRGLFEVVLEVESLDSAVTFYQRLGFEIVDRGDERRRVRLTTGEIDLEIWEPQLGLADARGGVHVDWGVDADDPEALADRVRDDAVSIDSLDGGYRIRDPDGHYLTLFETE